MFQRKNSNKTQCDAGCLEYILADLSENRIDTVNTSHITLTRAQLDELCSAINTSEKVKKVYLDHCQIDDDCTDVIADFLRNNDTVLELNLDNNNISDKGFATIADALVDRGLFMNKQRRYSFIHPDILHLSPSDQTQRSINHNVTLLSLSCEHNQLGDQALQTVQRLLLGNQRLTKLSLLHNPMRNEIKLAIENSRKFNKDIKLSARTEPVSQRRHGLRR